MKPESLSPAGECGIKPPRQENWGGPYDGACVDKALLGDDDSDGG